jgi:hypothetical protein
MVKLCGAKAEDWINKSDVYGMAIAGAPYLHFPVIGAPECLNERINANCVCFRLLITGSIDKGKEMIIWFLSGF